MKTLAALLASVLLVALALAGSSHHRTVKASRQARQAGAAAHQDWRISSPASFDNLTLFPVLSEQAASVDDFITLDEGLRSGKVIITELGADGRSHRLRAHRRSDDNAEVNRLALTNRSGKKLILIAGEMIVGGKQDRIVGHDCVIEATARPVPIDVFCVEHGRWSGSESFGQSRSDGEGSIRESRIGQRQRRGHGGGIGRGAGGVVGAGRGYVAGGTPGGVVSGVIAMPMVREKAQASKSQSDVWSKVSETVAVNRVSSDTGDLKSVYEDKHVNRKLDDYERAFKTRLQAANIVGVVAAINGRIISADVFANHRLFQAYWPKVLKSYALQAVSATERQSQEVARGDAEAYLARVEGATAATGDQGAYRLVENQSNKDASFELESRAARRPLIHFNRVSKE
ncbi:MAG: ARPP-1 family domain-containing protein [Blastocatellia bacterium]